MLFRSWKARRTCPNQAACNTAMKCSPSWPTISAKASARTGRLPCMQTQSSASSTGGMMPTSHTDYFSSTHGAGLVTQRFLIINPNVGAWQHHAAHGPSSVGRNSESFSPAMPSRVRALKVPCSLVELPPDVYSPETGSSTTRRVRRVMRVVHDEALR